MLKTNLKYMRYLHIIPKTYKHIQSYEVHVRTCTCLGPTCIFLYYLSNSFTHKNTPKATVVYVPRVYMYFCISEQFVHAQKGDIGLQRILTLSWVSLGAGGADTIQPPRDKCIISWKKIQSPWSTTYN